ncbi:MAG: hypothetical protein WDW38_011241 [Sanguina aurantia]
MENSEPEEEEVQTPEELWQVQDRYQKAVEYWDAQEPTYNGVLGGFGFVSDIDVRDSKQLLLKAMKGPLAQAESEGRRLTALDCGAGVGRVSEQLLLHHFHEVDVLEPSEHLLLAAEKNLTPEKLKALRCPAGHKAVNFYCVGLEQHQFVEARYDCIWVQWCLLYLTDVDTVTLLRKCVAGLTRDGLIFVKENIARESDFAVDHEDKSLTRSNAYMLRLFEQADMQVMYNLKQRGFPKELFEVRMYALRPRVRHGDTAPQPQPQQSEAPTQEGTATQMAS